MSDQWFNVISQQVTESPRGAQPPMLYPDHQEMALNRIATAVERLTDAMAQPAGVDLAEWVDSLSPIELDAAVNDLLRKGERGNCMELVLMTLRDWAAKA